MSAPITPCLWFDGQAMEAAQTYVSIFPDSRILHASYVGPDHPAGLIEGSVLTVSFELEGRPYLALNGGPGFPFSNAVSFQTVVDTQEQVDARWDALVEGGREVQCFWLLDRFGLPWQVVPQCFFDAMQIGGEVAERVMTAMFTMVKPDVALLQRAARGE